MNNAPQIGEMWKYRAFSNDAYQDEIVLLVLDTFVDAVTQHPMCTVTYLLSDSINPWHCSAEILQRLWVKILPRED